MAETWRQMWAAVKAQFPDAILTSAYRPGDPGYHGRGQAIDIARPYPAEAARMLVFNKWIAANFPQSTELIHTPGVNLKNGVRTIYGAQTQREHYNHVHWAMTTFVPPKTPPPTPVKDDFLMALEDWQQKRLYDRILRLSMGVPGENHNGSQFNHEEKRFYDLFVKLDDLNAKLDNLAGRLARLESGEGSPTPQPQPEQHHTIERGDTYWSLAGKYGTTVDELKRLNPDVNPGALAVGQKIRVK